MKTKDRIVILADKRDGHLPFVMRHLDEEPIVIDTGRILEGDHLTYRTNRSSGNEIIYMGEPIGPVRSVWYRRLPSDRILEAPAVAAETQRKLKEPTAATISLHRLVHDLVGDANSLYAAAEVPVAAVYQEYARSSLNRLATAITMMFSRALWVSHREAIVNAEHKPYQLKLAQRLGLEVPDTTITSDPIEAGAFLRAHGTCVVKPLALHAPVGQNQYTQKLQAAEHLDFSGLEVNPHIFQEVIVPDHELRVTIIGERVFAAVVVDTASPSTELTQVRDWRQSFETETFTARETILPSRVARALVEMVREYGLAAGMIDLIVDQEGRYFFLEINPNGAWGFIEEKTGQPIGKTLAGVLSCGFPQKFA